MIALTDSVEIKAKPEKVFAWLTNIKNKENYQSWHSDHVDCVWVKGEPFQEGSIVYFEEYIHGKLHKLKFLCTKRVQNRLIEYRPLFPWSFFMPKCTFVIEPQKEDSCIFTATINLRVGPLFKKFGGKRLDTIKRHMREEGENLKRILEKRKVNL